MELRFSKLLECGDTIMADQGFNTDDMLLRMWCSIKCTPNAKRI